MSERISIHEYYLKIAQITSLRSNCIKRKVGCVIVKNDRIISCGYNGTPRNTPNCSDGGCERCNNSSIQSGSDLNMCKCLHAEENALLFCDYQKLENSTIYCTTFPCLDCCKKIIQCRVKNVYYIEEYHQSNKINFDYLNKYVKTFNVIP